MDPISAALFLYALLSGNTSLSALRTAIEVILPHLRKGQDMYFNQMEFGQRIKELRTLKGLTQEELAEEVSVSYEHMNKVERGKHGCSLDLLLELSAFFEVSTDYLLTGRDFSNMAARKRLQGVVEDLTSIIHGME